MKKYITSVIVIILSFGLMFGQLIAGPTEKPATVSFLTKISAVSAVGGSALLYGAFSQLYKDECLAKDEVMENNEFNKFVLKIIKGIFSLDADVRATYHEKYPKITTLLVITAASYSFAGVFSFNDICNWIVRKPVPQMCTMETQCSPEIIEADRKAIVAGTDDQSLSAFQGSKHGLSMEEIKILCPSRNILDLSKAPAIL